MYDHTQKILLGDFPQKIHVRFSDPDAPILLVLHGGPGMANRHSLMTQHSDLARDFVLVAWDQRGCAGSYAGVDPATLSVERLVEDANELVHWLCEQFGQEKVTILGGSWGSQLGTLLAYRHPQHIAAYVGTGQVVDGVENERISWKFTVAEAKRTGDTKALQTLYRIGPPAAGQYRGGLSGLVAQRQLLARFGGSTRAGSSLFWSYVWPPLSSREYSPADIWGYLRGYRLVLGTMWPELTAYDLRREARQFALPFYIFQGRHDQNTPAELVEQYFAVLEAPHKELIWFEQSAHSPLSDEPERFKRLLREKLLN
ncbi:MAG: alpha/beta hydrolase [Coriobacteriales bacterium]|jgi:pimeloyl-ACP methyl ester carboxylesterase|nr:alpha/beta hydrolase [Coriobacteriales bacterium]